MLKFALQNLLSRKLRSLLSLLGLTVAIAGMVGLFSVAEGLDKTVDDTFRQIPGLTVMQPGSPVPLFSKLPVAWEADLKRVAGDGIVNAQILGRANVIEGKPAITPPRLLLGVDVPSRVRLRRGVYRENMVEGRFLTDGDVGTLNVVVSRFIANQYDKTIGDTLTVDGFTLTIVGIYHSGLPFLDVVLILDIERVREMTRFDGSSVSIYYVEQAEGVDPDALKARIEDAFRGKSSEKWQAASLLGSVGDSEVTGALWKIVKAWWLHRPPDERPKKKENQPVAKSTQLTGGTAKKPQDELPIEVRTADDWAGTIDKFSDDLDLFLIIMTSIGVVIAVLSIINTMLMSVTERVVEFGILKANGWTKLDVLKLITGESALIGLCGGVLGAAVGWTATISLNAIWPDRVSLFAGPSLLLFSIGFSTVVGIVGGLYPAWWAMRMAPMDAIRRG